MKMLNNTPKGERKRVTRVLRWVFRLVLGKVYSEIDCDESIAGSSAAAIFVHVAKPIWHLFDMVSFYLRLRWDV